MKPRPLLAICLCLTLLELLHGQANNIQPILSGLGKLIFPETSPSATISASQGRISIAAGGANQSIVLSPSGAGNVGIGNTAPKYRLDVSGDANTSTQYRVGGTPGQSSLYMIPGGGSLTFTGGIETAQVGTFAGLTGTFTVRNSAGTGTCTFTFNGGILTAETC